MITIHGGAKPMQTERPWVESLVACIPDPLAFLREDWHIIWANREFSQALGLMHSVRGMVLSELIQDWATIAARVPVMLGETKRISLEVLVYTATGDTIPMRMNLARCHDQVDAAWAVHLHDLQEISSLVQQLGDREKSHAFLRANTSDLIVRTDADLVVSWSNESAAATFPRGSVLADVLAPDSLLSLTVNHGERYEVALQSRPGLRPLFFLRGFARAITDESGTSAGISMILRDDSEHHRLALLTARLSLTPRESEVVEYLLKGYSNLNIASIMGLSESGVKFHIRNVLARAKVNTRTELMALAMGE